VPGKKMIIRYYNDSGSLENLVKFLENVKKKINFINFSIDCDRNNIKIVVNGTKDLQYLAREKLQDLAKQFLKKQF
jgi:hypothetical protein